jgi:hypothetical protein
MYKEIDQLLRRGFCAISIMADPDGSYKDSNEVWGESYVYISITHKQYTSELRFLFRSIGFTQTCDTLRKLVKMYDDRKGDVWELSNQKRIPLNLLPTDKILIQGTINGLKIAREILGLTIHDQREVKPTPRPGGQSPTCTS